MPGGTEVTKCFQTRLEDLIQNCDLSIKELAAEIGISAGTLSNYQNDASVANINSLAKIAKYFGVSCDWLLGFSDNRDSENVPIGEIIGLSDGAIKNLKHSKNIPSYMPILNYIIEEKKCLRLIRNYLLAFVTRTIRDTDYREIPLYSSVRNTQDVSLAALLGHLPIMGQEVERILLKNDHLMENLYFEFLSKNADIFDCKNEIGLFPSFPDPFDIDDEVYIDETPPDMTDEERKQMEVAIEADLHRRTVIKDFLERLEQLEQERL